MNEMLKDLIAHTARFLIPQAIMLLLLCLFNGGQGALIFLLILASQGLAHFAGGAKAIKMLWEDYNVKEMIEKENKDA
jgi:hypothetical protein